MTESRPAAPDDSAGVGRHRRGRKRLTPALMVAVVAAVIGLAGLALPAHRGGTPGPDAKPPPLSTTSMEDWTKSVCRPGSCGDGVIGGALPNATGSGHCTGQKNADLIMVGSYARGRLLKDDIGPYRAAISATIKLTSGEIFAFVAPLPQDGSVLDPLTKYGFAVHSN